MRCKEDSRPDEGGRSKAVGWILVLVAAGAAPGLLTVLARPGRTEQTARPAGETGVMGQAGVIGERGYEVTGSYYVATNGSDANPGTVDLPFRTIQRAIDVLQPGDTCYVRGGRYHETVQASGLRGAKGQPITIQAYPGEEVVLDGAEPISGPWEQHQGSIYRTTLSKDIWQLFLDGEEMIPARWPNGRFDDGSVWDREMSWAPIDPASSYGTTVSQELANTGKDFTGAMMVLNTWWVTHSRKVRDHAAGSDTFVYDTDWDFKPIRNPDWLWTDWIMATARYGFFLEGHLNCLDTPKEWHFDPESKDLYFWAPDGGPPSGDLRGKTMEHAFDLADASYVTLRGLQFHACTFRFDNATHCTVEDCAFRYSGCSQRTLGVPDNHHTVSTIMSGPDEGSWNTIRNCTFAHTDGGAFSVRGRHDLVENLLVHDIDWSAVSEDTVHVLFSHESTFRRITAYRTGASECLFPGSTALVELCDFGPDLGLLEWDGAAVQMAPRHMDGAVVRYCWSHDHEKFGIRADFHGVPGEKFPVGFGFNVTFHHNVLWGQRESTYQPPMWVSGDRHRIVNNLSYGNASKDITVWGGDTVWGDAGPNQNTITRNNTAGEITFNRNTDELAPGVVDHNFIGNVPDQVRDWENRDFRPRPGSELIDAGTEVPGIVDGFKGRAPDVGPYEYGDDNYWIPGYQAAKATAHLPQDAAAVRERQVDLIWLEGWRSISSDVYFGESMEAVAQADHQSPEFKGSQTGNIYQTPELKPGRTYYWRIDTCRPEERVQGDVWSFRATD